jgi:hypothetical protein
LGAVQVDLRGTFLDAIIYMEGAAMSSEKCPNCGLWNVENANQEHPREYHLQYILDLFKIKKTIQMRHKIKIRITYN